MDEGGDVIGRVGGGKYQRCGGGALLRVDFEVGEVPGGDFSGHNRHLVGFFLVLGFGRFIPASDIAMAMACLRDFTTGPSEPPEWRVPEPYSDITFDTFLAFAALDLAISTVRMSQSTSPDAEIGAADGFRFG